MIEVDKMIYFDNSATTAVHPAVLDTYVKTSQRILGNPSSLHQLGNQASRLITESRKQIAEGLSVKPNEIYFTSGGTEGNNWIIKGTALAKGEFGKHMIISSVEHSAVTNTVRQLENQGFEVSIAPVDSRGRVDVAKLKELLRPDTILVSVMAVNNEIGAVQPIQEIGDLLVDHPTTHFHVDAVQAIGKIPTSTYLTDRVDFVTFSAHKFHGPKGMGFIYWKEGRRIEPLLNGGGQEGNQRSGTENVPGIVSMARAVRLHLTDQELKNKREENIKSYLIDSLKKYPKVTLFSELNDDFAPHIICFGLKDIKGEVLVHAFETKDIIISTTSACSSKSKVSGGTLHGMNVPEAKAITAVRASINADTTMVEAEQFMVAFHQLQEKFSKINN